MTFWQTMSLLYVLASTGYASKAACGGFAMTDYTERFEQRVWFRYPKRNGVRSGKKPAFERWKKLSEKQKLHVIDQIDKRNRYNGWGKYIKDLERWLRDNVDDEFEIPRTYRDPQAIDIPAKEGPKQDDPAKAAFNRVFRDWIWTYYFKGRGPAIPDSAIKKMLRKRDEFAVILLEAWENKEPLDGLQDAFMAELDQIALGP